ncbi:MAG: hypothetical protein GY842_22385 [bacterium]|nr:hypothetical protein [bacterium]
MSRIGKLMPHIGMRGHAVFAGYVGRGMLTLRDEHGTRHYHAGGCGFAIDGRDNTNRLG